MAKADLFEWTDLLGYACTIGYDWNQAHEILVRDEVPPMYEIRKRELYLGEGVHYGWGEDTCRIVDGFLKEQGLESCIIV